MKKLDTQGSPDFSHSSTLLKIISVLCALLLWFYVSAVESPNSEKTFDGINITLKNRDLLSSEAGLAIVSDADYRADVVLSGKRSVLNKIDYSEIIATVDLSGIKEAGQYELPVKISAPTGTSIASATPGYVSITVDTPISAPFELEAEINYSNLPSSYELGDYRIVDTQGKELKTVTVTGPKTELERIARVVARVDLGSINASAEARTNLVLLDANDDEMPTSNITLTTKTVIVKQPVYITKTVPLSVSQANNTFLDDQISFKINPSTIEVKGDPKVLEKITSLPLDPINEREIGTSLVTEVVTQIKLPDGIELLSPNTTATIKASVSGVQCEKIKVTEDNLRVINNSNRFSVNVISLPETVTVINASNKKVTRDDVYFEIDLESYTNAIKYTVMVSPRFKDNHPWAYFPDESYTLTFELSEK